AEAVSRRLARFAHTASHAARGPTAAETTHAALYNRGKGGPVRVAHFDPFSGISGDMTLAALIDAGVDAEAIRAGIASLGLPITLEIEKVRKGGFAATYVRIEAPEEHTHRFLPDVEAILNRGKLTERQRGLALKIF